MLRINLTHRVEELDPILPEAEFLEDQQLAELKAGMIRRRRVLELSFTTQGPVRRGGSWLRYAWPPALHRERMAYLKLMGEDCGFEGGGGGQASFGAAYAKAVLIGSLPEGLTVGILGAAGVLPPWPSLAAWVGIIALWAAYILWRWTTALLRARGSDR